MSFASILSEPATNVTPSAPKSSKKPSMSRKFSPVEVGIEKDAAQKRETSVIPVSEAPGFATGHSKRMNGYIPTPKPRKILTARENEKVSKALALIDEAVFSDVETAGFDAEEMQYLERSKKRALEVGEVEARKRKVCKGKLCHDYETH